MLRKLSTISALMLAVVLTACGSDPVPSRTSGSGGNGSGGRTGGSGGNTAGSGGNTAGSGGSSAGSGGATAGSGGATAGSGGATAGSGGSPAGSGGAADGGTDTSVSSDASGTGGADGGPVGTIVAQACAFEARVHCQRYEACLPVSFQYSHGDQARCQATNLAECLQKRGLPMSKTTPADINACATAVLATNCDQWEAYSDHDLEVPAACKTIPGAAADGQGCAVDDQCISGYCRQGAGALSCGVCRAKAAVDGSCNSDTGCAGTAICVGGRCSATVGAGVACRRDWECAVDLYCVRGKCDRGGAPGASCETGRECAINVVCRNNKCEHMGKAGDPCFFDRDDGTDSCLEGNLCGPANTCVALKIARPGQPCDVEGGTQCDPTSTCSREGGPGFCVLDVVIGAACNPNRDFCEYPADCIGGKCIIRDLSVCR